MKILFALVGEKVRNVLVSKLEEGQESILKNIFLHEWPSSQGPYVHLRGLPAKMQINSWKKHSYFKYAFMLHPLQMPHSNLFFPKLGV